MRVPHKFSLFNTVIAVLYGLAIGAIVYIASTPRQLWDALSILIGLSSTILFLKDAISALTCNTIWLFIFFGDFVLYFLNHNDVLAAIMGIGIVVAIINIVQGLKHKKGW